MVCRKNQQQNAPANNKLDVNQAHNPFYIPTFTVFYFVNFFSCYLLAHFSFWKFPFWIRSLQQIYVNSIFATALMWNIESECPTNSDRIKMQALYGIHHLAVANKSRMRIFIGNDDNVDCKIFFPLSYLRQISWMRRQLAADAIPCDYFIKWNQRSFIRMLCKFFSVTKRFFSIVYLNLFSR